MGEEQRFAEEVLPAIGPPDIQRWLVPQIALSCLCDGIPPEAQSRGDFYLAHPTAGELLIEIDGPQHAESVEADARRDDALTAAGIRVHRIPTREILEGSGPALEGLKGSLEEWPSEDGSPEGPVGTSLRLCQMAHQLQLALLEALRGGRVAWEQAEWAVSVTPPLRLADRADLGSVLRIAAEEFIELMARLLELYGRVSGRPTVQLTLGTAAEVPPQITVTWGTRRGAIRAAAPEYSISSTYVNRHAAAPLTTCSPMSLASPPRECVRWFLDALFRKDDFWEGQWETIERTLEGKDSIVLLPTGGGKSIAFQLAALLLPGRCIVIDPIISLIDDQIDNLRGVGIDRCVGITSQTGSADKKERILSQLAQGHYLFCYVAPERFQMVPFREALRQITTAVPVSLIAIDEAHCVSEWGHDFRTAYLNIGRITREYCKFHERTPPLVALTGTASRIVLKDVQRELGIPDFDAIITPKTFDRSELQFHIERCGSAEKIQRISGVLARLPSDFGLDRTTFYRPRGESTSAGLLFCPHVNGPFGIQQTAALLEKLLQISVPCYSGTPPKGMPAQQWAEAKALAAHRFKRNLSPLMVCTKAFGMGIDKPNVRYTIHTGLPESIEAFFQEAGRAGRDRRQAHCWVVLSVDDPDRADRLLSPNASIDDIAEETRNFGGDDVTRDLFLHVGGFRGEGNDLREVEIMLDALGNLERRAEVTVAFDQTRRDQKEKPHQRQEKALHRLVVIGVVDDYTLDYSRGEFTVKLSGASKERISDALGRYVATYQEARGAREEEAAREHLSKPHREFIRAVAARLIGHIYLHIERARRRALLAMLEACQASGAGDGLRERILDYLEEHEQYDALLHKAPASEVGGLDLIAEIVDLLVTPNDLAEVDRRAHRGVDPVRTAEHLAHRGCLVVGPSGVGHRSVRVGRRRGPARGVRRLRSPG